LLSTAQTPGKKQTKQAINASEHLSICAYRELFHPRYNLLHAKHKGEEFIAQNILLIQSIYIFPRHASQWLTIPAQS